MVKADRILASLESARISGLLTYEREIARIRRQCLVGDARLLNDEIATRRIATVLVQPKARAGKADKVAAAAIRHWANTLSR